jgi:radical SAM superfamily enzyme YgiQ (UPF0313 family)
VKVLFVYPRFQRHAEAHPELKQWVPMNEYLGSPSLGLTMIAAMTPDDVVTEFRDDRLSPADVPTDADLVAFSFFTPAATRAIELAAYFRAQGKTTVCGGIFPTMMPEVVAPHFDAVVVGEGERVWGRVLADFRAGQLLPRYQATEVQCLDDLPLPRYQLYLDQERRGVFEPDDYPVQISRGCPMSCQACVLPTSMTRTFRDFPLEHVVGQLKLLAAHGKRACLTEDTSWFPGHATRQLKALFQAIVTQGAPANISYIGISMPMILTTTAATLALARQAGVTMFYLVGGFDPVTRGAFTGTNPRALQQAKDAITKSLDLGIEPYTSFLLGNDEDDLGTVDRMLDFCRVAGVRKAEFAIFTPYPGTPSWDRLVKEERILDRTWSHYNDANAVFQPAQMTPDQLTAGYLRLWREFYSDKGHFQVAGQAERTIQF